MTERLRGGTAHYQSTAPKMEYTGDLSPRKTMFVLVIVVGCFAVLWPKVFYPMLVGSAQQHMRPSAIDKTTGCCDVISELDVNTIKILSELCGSITKTNEDGTPLKGREIVEKCKKEILDTCGIDISPLLQQHVKLGQNVKQILNEIRSLNGSLCLKYNYGVSPWALGVPHRVTVNMPSTSNIRQERPLHLRSEMIHPAFRERGRAIPQAQASTPSRPAPRIVEGTPGPIPGMRPTIGGPGQVVPPKQTGASSMSIIMPIYTVGIVIFFTYTLMKIMFKKQPEGPGGSLYPPVTPDPHFRKEVFESTRARMGPRLSRDNVSSKLVVNAMSALLDEVDQELEARRKSSERCSNQQDLPNSNLLNGNAHKPQDEEQPRVTVLGMEMTASCEGGQKWSRPDSPTLSAAAAASGQQHDQTPAGPPPQEIYLEGALPPQSQLLVADSATETQSSNQQGEDPAVVLAGKMTLSVISLDSSENGTENGSGSSFEDLTKETIHLNETKINNNSNESNKVSLENVEKQFEQLIKLNQVVPKDEKEKQDDNDSSIDLKKQVDDLVKEIEKDAVEAIVKILEDPLASQTSTQDSSISGVSFLSENVSQENNEAKIETKTQQEHGLSSEHPQLVTDEEAKMKINKDLERNLEENVKQNQQNDEQILNERLINNTEENENNKNQTEQENEKAAEINKPETENLLKDLEEQIKLQEKLLNDDLAEEAEAESKKSQESDKKLPIEEKHNEVEEVKEDEEVEAEEEVEEEVEVEVEEEVEEDEEEEEIEEEEDEEEEGELIEIEEIVYESDGDGGGDEENDDNENDIEENVRSQKLNGDDLLEESKQITISNDAAEVEISEEEVTDEEEVEDNEEDVANNHVANNSHVED